MKEFLNKNFISLIVIGLIVLLYLQRCSTHLSSSAGTIVHDTTHTITTIIHDSSFVTKPVITNTIASPIPPVMLPDTNYFALREQYTALLQKFYNKNVQKDSISLDSSGWATTLDTISQNLISSRKWRYNVREKIVTNTITNTVYPKPKFQLYMGGGILGSQEELVDGVSVGFLVKNKRDQIYGLSLQKTMGRPFTIEANSYWKIRFHK